MTRDPEDDLTFIAGADQAAALPGWREPAVVLELAELAVAEREQPRRDGVRDGSTALPEACPSACASSRCRASTSSSSLIRRRVAEGLPIRWLVPDAVGARSRSAASTGRGGARP